MIYFQILTIAICGYAVFRNISRKEPGQAVIILLLAMAMLSLFSAGDRMADRWQIVPKEIRTAAKGVII